MACYDVSAKTSVGRHGTFQIDSTSNGELCKCRAVQGLVHDIRSKAIREEQPDGQTDAVDGDAVADPGSFQNRFARTVSTAECCPRLMDFIVPTSSTIPVNTGTPPHF